MLGLAGMVASIHAHAATPTVSYGTYFGGSGTETVAAVALDSQGNVVIAGTTTSTDLPGTAGSYQPNHAFGFSRNSDVFVAKFDPTGHTLLWATYLGGDADERLVGMAVGPMDSIYLTGTTTSNSFPFTSKLPGSFSSAFAAEVTSDGKRLVYATALPIGPTCIAVNAAGETYFAGMGSAVATNGALNATGGDLLNSAILLKLNASGSGIIFLARLGEGSTYSIALDSQGNVYVGGSTGSSGSGGSVLTTASSFEPTDPNKGLSGNPIGVGFLQKVNSSGTQLIYGTYFGPRYAFTTVTSLAVGPDGTVYFGGTTSTNSITATAGAFQSSPGPGNSGYLATLNPAGTVMGAFSYLPESSSLALTVGQGNILHCLNSWNYLALNASTLSLVAQAPAIYDGFQLALNSSNDLWIVGAGGPTFVTTDAFQSTPKGASNAFLVEMTPANGLSITAGTLAAGAIGAPYSQTLSANGGAPPYHWSMASGALPNGLRLSVTGTISGTPTTVGTSGFTVKVTDSTSSAVTQSSSITINLPVPASLSISNGNNQTGTPGTTLPQEFMVKVLGSDGNPFAGATVTFAVASGNASLSPGTATTGADGTAATSITCGSTLGPIQVTASVSGVPSVTFSAAVTAPAPQIPLGGVMSAGLSSPPVQTISPNAIVSIFGQNFAAPGTTVRVTPADLVNGQIPTNLAGVCVVFSNQRAPVFVVTPGQLNVQVPQGPFPSTVTIQVITNCDTPSQSVSNQLTAPTHASAPEFFYAANNVNGRNPISAVDGLSGAQLGDPAQLGGLFTLAYPGEVVTIYCTGLGVTTPAFAAGQLATSAARVDNITVMIDGVAVVPSAVQYAGAVPGAAGLYQLNLQLPMSLTPGDHRIVMIVNGATSPSLAYISVGTAK
jgi:uncharacterized protein (TIGR03437 family)